MPPQIIILNGTGSSGKTGIARVLIEKLQTQYLNFSIDSVLYSLPPSDLQKMMAGKAITRDGYSYPKLVEGYHQAARGLAKAGCRLILDNAWIPEKEKLDMLNTLSEFDVCLVGVKCHLLVAMERERQRGDRAIGLAESEYNHVHTNMSYDFEVDTTKLSSEVSADQIMAFFKTKPALSGAPTSRKTLEKIAISETQVAN
ncbi:chloramphenicol phosphotransferase CPT family protein [Enterovibrio calviensis]|uniref:chloramphenicol phosphotransferase CPT family protein n=1 Tax=Enterovibrio calviensis TaxID=91359 RepID=UPI0037359891